MVDIRTRVQHFAKELGVSVDSLEERYALYGMLESDREALSALARWTQENIQALVDRYLTVMTDVLEQNVSLPDLDQLPLLFGQYLTDMFSGKYDESYLQRRIRVGIVHHTLGIPKDRYVAALSRLLSSMIQSAPEIAAFAGLPVLDITNVLTKIFIFDISLVTEVYTHEEHRSIEHLAKHDSLTGLPNHNLLHETLKRYLKKCNAQNPLAVMFIGLNSFKAVNETLGHDVGDIILKDVGARLMGLIPPRGIAARVGGDIFVMLAPLEAETPVEILTQRVLGALNEPLSLEGFSVDVSATVGVVIASSSGIPAAGLMSQAEMALYHAKRHQLTSTAYSANMRRYSRGHLAIGTELKRAIENNELILLFQPKISVAEREVVGVEALIRWLHPFRGLIPPHHFIPLAEKSALIHTVTDWVIKAALKQLVELHARGFPLNVAVNLAAPNLQNYELPDRIKQLIESWRVPPEYLTLEITESSLMVDPKRAHDTVRRLRDLGARLSIDDFGTGYSSLSYLKDLPVHEVKIDREFIRGLCQSKKNERIVRATIQLSHSLGLEVTAEGVEDEDTLQLLGFFGCDLAQGFYMSEPLPADDLMAWLEKYPH